MAKKTDGEGVYKIVEVVGVSEISWEDAGKQAVKTASKSLRDLRIVEGTKMDKKVEDGKVGGVRTRVSLSFKYEAYARSCAYEMECLGHDGVVWPRLGIGFSQRT